MNKQTLSFWYQLGPLFLLGAAVAVLFQKFSFEALILIGAFFGSVLIRRFEKKGLIASLFFLAALSVGIAFFSLSSFRLWFLSGAVGLSWLLTLLGMREAALIMEKNGGEPKSFETLKTPLPTPVRYLSSTKSAEQHNIVSQEEVAAEENWQQKYTQLQQQLFEKNQMLDETRRQLFQMESTFLTLQKESEEKEIDGLEEELKVVGHFKALEEELQHKEGEIRFLQEWISGLVEPKKVAKPRKPKQKIEEGMLPIFERLGLKERDATVSKSPPHLL